MLSVVFLDVVVRRSTKSVRVDGSPIPQSDAAMRVFLDHFDLPSPRFIIAQRRPVSRYSVPVVGLFPHLL